MSRFLCALLSTGICLACCALSVPAFADPAAPPPNTAAPAPAAEATPRVSTKRRVEKKAGKKPRSTAAKDESTPPPVAESPQKDSIDMEIAARAQTPVADTHITRQRFSLPLHELAGPYPEGVALGSP
jgi:hypothetical protein